MLVAMIPLISHVIASPLLEKGGVRPGLEELQMWGILRGKEA